jgi:hypothetical protein
MESTIFWDITPCSPLKVKRLFGEIYRLHFQGKPPDFPLVCCSVYLTLKMEAICFSKISVKFQRTTRRYISEDIITAVRALNITYIVLFDCGQRKNERLHDRTVDKQTDFLQVK